MPNRPARRLPAGLVTTLLALALSFTAPHADAQWKWRGKDGRINVSDRPPPSDIPDKDILGRPAADARRSAAAAATAAAASAAASAPALQPAAKAPPGPLDREVEARKRAADQEQAAKAKAEEERVAAARAENCRRARAQQAALDSGQRIARINDKGEREVMDDKARAEEMRQVREVIASDCK